MRAQQRVGIAAFVAGAVSGGLLVLSAVWLLTGIASPLPHEARMGIVAAAAGVTLARDLGWVRFPLPQNARQIPQEVLRPWRHAGAYQFGFELGTGMRTYLPSTLPYLLVLATLVLGHNYSSAAAAGTAFGLSRAVPPVLGYLGLPPAPSLGELRWVQVAGAAAALVVAVVAGR